MTSGLLPIALAIMVATATLIMIIREMHLRALNTRVSNAVLGLAGKPAPVEGMSGWFSALGMRYRRFYAPENLEQLRTVLQSSGFNRHRALPIWIGVKTVCMYLFP